MVLMASSRGRLSQLTGLTGRAGLRYLPICPWPRRLWEKALQSSNETWCLRCAEMTPSEVCQKLPRCAIFIGPSPTSWSVNSFKSFGFSSWTCIDLQGQEPPEPPNTLPTTGNTDHHKYNKLCLQNVLGISEVCKWQIRSSVPCNIRQCKNGPRLLCPSSV